VDAVSLVAGLHQLAEDLDAELVVLGAQHRNAVLRALRGDIATELTSHGTWGVAVAHEDRASGPPRRVGVAWDQTPAANVALEWGIQLVERTGGELRSLRVFIRSARIARARSPEARRKSGFAVRGGDAERRSGSRSAGSMSSGDDARRPGLVHRPRRDPGPAS
jgi:nucleotide-binding universal stress UspA family protein